MITNLTQIATLFQEFQNYRIRFSKDNRNNRLLLFIDINTKDGISLDGEHLTILIPYDCKKNKNCLEIKNYFDFKIVEVVETNQAVNVKVNIKLLKFGEYIGQVCTSFQLNKVGVYNAVGKSHSFDSFMNLVSPTNDISKEYRLSA